MHLHTCMHTYIYIYVYDMHAGEQKYAGSTILRLLLPVS